MKENEEHIFYVWLTDCVIMQIEWIVSENSVRQKKSNHIQREWHADNYICEKNTYYCCSLSINKIYEKQYILN